MTVDSNKLEREITQFGSEIFEAIRVTHTSLLNSQFYTEKFLSWGMSDEKLKVALFRFVDVLPSLPNSASVIEHVQEYFEPLRGVVPDLLLKGLSIAPHSLTADVVAKVIRKNVSFVAGRFIVGSNAEKALRTLKKIRSKGMSFTVDLVGEAAVSESEAHSYERRYLELIETLAKETPKWSDVTAFRKNHRSESTAANISVKLSALYSQAKAISAEKTVAVLCERFANILDCAMKQGAFVYVDMEDCSLTSITLEVFKKILTDERFAKYDRCGIVLQAYLKRTKDDLEDLISWLKVRKVPIAVRLVKGAYWDTETIIAKQSGWPSPVWSDKQSSDANYEALSIRLLEEGELIIPAFASHNVRSLCHAIKVAENMGVPTTKFELQTLYGMGDPIKKAFADRGYLVREYCPVGDLIPSMGYLVRRLLENTANESFLRLSFHEQADTARLLAKPQFSKRDKDSVTTLLPQKSTKSSSKEFSNSPLRDFSLSSVRQSFSNAVAELSAKVGKQAFEVCPIVDGKEIKTNNQLQSRSPQDSAVLLANISLADSKIAETSLRSLQEYFPQWRSSKVSQRCAIARRAAEIMERKREEIAAVIILEVGKPWIEADADVAEAIDFLNYYSLQAEELFEKKNLGDYPGESNHYFFEPRGTTVVISPWNFPFAIPCGMFSAALICGNCAVLKPAEQSTLTAKLLFDIFLEAGLPPRAAAFLPGLGEEVGAYISNHPSISTIAFTGSKAVGLSLIESGAKVRRGQEHICRVIAEMGGKNAIIVDEDAELDEAVKGVINSAFGYQGQKCSACSRAIVVGTAYERFLERLKDAVESIIVGPPSDPATFVGPVIDKQSYERISSVIAQAEQSCRLVARASLANNLAKTGNYIAPVVFADIPKGHPILVEEIFGPVLSVIKCDSFESALREALDSEYGLTGGLFSRSPKNIARTQEEFRVGNLYINRGCTGALVMRQPFGGAKMSGVGSKAGGPDYLHQFVIPRAISENTVRRGFAPS